MTTKEAVATHCQMPYCNKQLVACDMCDGSGERGRRITSEGCGYCNDTGRKCPEHGKNWQYKWFSPKIQQIGKWLYEAYCRRSSQPDKLWQYDHMPEEEKQAWLGAVESVFAEHYNQIDELRKVLQKIY